MTRDEILKKAREQRSGGAEEGAVLDAASLADVQAKAKAQRGAVESPEVKAPTAAPEQPSAVSRGAKKAAMGIMGPAGSILEMTGLDKSLAGAGEAALAFGSGLAGQVVGGLAGLGSAAMNGADAGAETVKDVQEALTYTPKTEKGQEYVENIGGALAPVGEAITATSEALGDTAFDITGSPAIATAFYTAPDALLEVTGLGLAGKASRTARLAKQSNEVKAATDLLQNTEVRVADAMGAQWKLDKNGVAVPNTLGREMVKQGDIGASQAALITNSNKATRTQMDAMTDAFNRRAVDDPRGLSPNQIIGVNTGRALTEANKARQALGKQLDEVVSGPLGKTEVDIKPAMEAFYADLSDLGIRPNVDMNTGKAYLDFRGSQLDFDTYKGAQRLLNDGFQMTTYKGKPTLADAHRMKQALDDLLDARKLEQGGALGNMERKLLTLRSGLNEATQQVTDYATINAKYSDLRDGLDSFSSYKPAGKSWDSPKVMNNVGSALKSAAVDTAAVNNMLESLTGLNNTMQSIGAKPFSVDVAGLARYSDFLNNQWSRSVVDSVPQGGFLRGARQNAQGAALSAMVGNKFGVANNISGLVANGLDVSVAKEAARKAKQNQAIVRRALKQP